MTSNPDLGPAASAMAALLTGITDEQLRAPTPCGDYTLGDLVEHVIGLAGAFTDAADKAPGTGGDAPPPGDAARLGADWRDRAPEALDRLVEAWRRPEAWAGMTRIAGLELPGEAAGAVAVEELVVHGWDVARALGRPYEIDDASLELAAGFLEQFSQPGQEEMRGDAYGPVVTVRESAPLLDRVIGMSGRDPGWAS